jgi:hypothetical protein
MSKHFSGLAFMDFIDQERKEVLKALSSCPPTVDQLLVIKGRSEQLDRLESRIKSNKEMK